MRTMGASCSGSSVQLVSRDGSTRWTVRSVRGRRADLRSRGRLDCEGRCGGRAAARGRRVDRRDGVRRVRRPASPRRRPLPRRVHGLGRHEAHPRAPARGALRARPISPRTASTTSRRAEPIRSSSSTTWQRTASTSRRSPPSWREPPRSAARRASRSSAARRRSCRASIARRSSTSPTWSASSSGAASSTVARGRGRCRRSSVRGRPRERLHARPPRARGRGLRGRGPARADVSTSTTLVAFALARAPRTSPAEGSSGISSVSYPTVLHAEIDWSSWQRPAVFVARPACRRGRASACLQPRIGYLAVSGSSDELVIGRIARGDRRARVRRGNEFAGAPRCRPPRRRGGVERRGARAIGRAQSAGIAATVFPAEEYADRDARDSAMADWLQEHGVELVVCAGYMQLLRPSFLARFPGRVVNVGALPAFRERTRSTTYWLRALGPRRRRSTTWTTASTPAM